MRRVFEHGPENWESRAAVELHSLIRRRVSTGRLPYTYLFLQGGILRPALFALARKYSHCRFLHTLFRLLFNNPPRSICHCAFGRHQQCVGRRRVQLSPTAVLVRTQRCSGPLANMWRSEPTSRTTAVSDKASRCYW
jgi:hypothetical protein